MNLEQFDQEKHDTEELLAYAKKLEDRVKELESFIFDYIATDCMTRQSAMTKGNEILNKDWKNP